MRKSICTRCHGKRIKEGLNGSPAIELLLWLCFLLPGMIYTWTRTHNRPLICKDCGSHDVVPLDSPRGRALKREVAE